MSKYNVVKSYYKRRLWNAGMLENAVGKWITEEEHGKILEEVETEWAEEEAQRLAMEEPT